MKQSKFYYILILVLIAGAVWFFMSRTSETTEQSNKSVLQHSNTETVVEDVPNGLEGELKKSDDPKKGNYMLLLNDTDKTIYLFTSRDFSLLIDKQVSVTIEGSLDDFRLLDIKAK